MDNDELWKRHHNRREVNWEPYHSRRSVGFLRYEDDGGKVSLRMEVAGLGVLIISGYARYSEILKHFKYDETAEVKAAIDEVPGQ